MPSIVGPGVKDDISMCELAALEKAGALEWKNFPHYFEITVSKEEADEIRLRHRASHKCYKFTGGCL